MLFMSSYVDNPPVVGCWICDTSKLRRLQGYIGNDKGGGGAVWESEPSLPIREPLKLCKEEKNVWILNAQCFTTLHFARPGFQYPIYVGLNNHFILQTIGNEK